MRSVRDDPLVFPFKKLEEEPQHDRRKSDDQGGSHGWKIFHNSSYASDRGASDFIIAPNRAF